MTEQSMMHMKLHQACLYMSLKLNLQSNNYQKFLNMMAEGIIRNNSNTQDAAA